MTNTTTKLITRKDLLTLLFFVLPFIAFLAITHFKYTTEADNADYIIKTSQSRIVRLIEKNCITLIAYSSELNLDESLNELVNNQYLKLKHKLDNEQQIEVKKTILSSLKHLVNEDKELFGKYINIVTNN
jgi:hypothetical protein